MRSRDHGPRRPAGWSALAFCWPIMPTLRSMPRAGWSAWRPKLLNGACGEPSVSASWRRSTTVRDRGRRGSSRRRHELFLVDLACRKPRDLGYPHELWSTRLLAEHAREHGPRQGSSQSFDPGSRHAVQDPEHASAEAAQSAILRRKARSLISRRRWPRFSASTVRSRC